MFNNVVLDDLEPYEIIDGDYFSDVFTILSQQLTNFNDYIFLVKNSETSQIPDSDLSWMGKKIILIWIGGEYMFHPYTEVKEKFHHIFAPYHWDVDNLTSIPLGCYAKTAKKIIPMEERLFNMSFVGCLNRNRMKLVSILTKLPKTLLAFMGWRKEKDIGVYAEDFRLVVSYVNHLAKWLNPRDFFKFTCNFAQGFDQDTYSNILHSSKISLCPRGWNNVESFRIYESMRAGCVTITEKLPDRAYYKDIPAIQVNDWEEGLEIARNLLRDDMLLKNLGEASRNFYECTLSPKATAKIIIDKLEG